MPDFITLKDVNRVYPNGLPLLGVPDEEPGVAAPAPWVEDETDRNHPRTVKGLLAWHERESANYAQADEVDADSSGVDTSAKGEVLHDEIVFIGRSMRRSLTRPTTPLHVLLLADRLSLPEIAGRMRTDPSDIELQVAQLVQVGLVAQDNSTAVPRFSIVGLSGE